MIQIDESIYYDGLVPRIHAHTPLYADALATPPGPCNKAMN
jgi:hypothetical protein